KVETTDRAGVTDGTGTVALRSIDVGSTRVEVAADGHAPASVYVSADDPALTVERTIELSPGALLSGIVLDETGSPLSNAQVNVKQGDRIEVRVVIEGGTLAGRVVDSGGAPVAEARLRARHVRTDQVYFAHADDDGRFDFGGMEPGDYKLTVNRPDLTYADEA